MFTRHITKVISNRNLYFYFFYWIIYLLFFTTQRFFALRMDIGDAGLIDKPSLDTLKESLYANLAYLPLVIIATHFVVNFILPKYYFRNRFYLFSIILISLITVYPFLVYILRKLVVEPFVLQGPMEYTWYNFFMAMLIFVFGMAPLVWFKMAMHLKEDALRHQKIEHDRLEAELKLRESELKLLKGQIHPHFLFNTLNNLYSLALEKSDKTPDLLIRLADMLSYIIYDCNSEKVPLTKEIDFINSFLELQKVRYDTCDISLKLGGELNNKQIAPMILHTFIDNTFKHGADKDSGSPWIKISITSKNGLLFFAALNSTKPNNESDKKIPGIGISNAKKRLELIYPDRHDLVINNSGNRYSVFLKLEL
jgi:two-component system LytT family sensor kinase